MPLCFGTKTWSLSSKCFEEAMANFDAGPCECPRACTGSSFSYSVTKKEFDLIKMCYLKNATELVSWLLNSSDV